MAEGAPFDIRPNQQWQAEPLSRTQNLRSELMRLGLPAYLLLKFDEEQLTAIYNALLFSRVVLPGVDVSEFLKDCIKIDLDPKVKFHMKEPET